MIQLLDSGKVKREGREKDDPLGELLPGAKRDRYGCLPAVAGERRAALQLTMRSSAGIVLNVFPKMSGNPMQGPAGLVVKMPWGLPKGGLQMPGAVRG